MEGELDEDESFCGSSLDFEENGEGEDDIDIENSSNDDQNLDKITQLKSYDHVPPCIQSQSTHNPEMLQHFNKINSQYCSNQPEKEVQLQPDKETAEDPQRHKNKGITEVNSLIKKSTSSKMQDLNTFGLGLPFQGNDSPVRACI